VHRDLDGSISLSQHSFITRMCDKFYLTDAKPVSSPFDAGQMSKLRSKQQATAEEFINVTKVPYRELIGGLLFVATRTRPDVAAAVGILARRLADPREIDWQAAKRVLRYLKGTASLALTFPFKGRRQPYYLRRCRLRNKFRQAVCEWSRYTAWWKRGD
jgi:hypothetical protein